MIKVTFDREKINSLTLQEMLSQMGLFTTNDLYNQIILSLGNGKDFAVFTSNYTGNSIHFSYPDNSYGWIYPATPRFIKVTSPVTIQIS